MEWQSIETAPKDGSKVELGWIVEDRLEWHSLARWTKQGWKHPLSGYCIDATHWKRPNPHS